ncbi:hypothetical protein M271_14470 [Streptomyces rapamycinicus NRRL 5491]|nr:hypothetical protein M271_14470 [Streptomyces rapamycinicus NRRL 5491]
MTDAESVRAAAVHIYGALRVTQEFLPLVRKAQAGRIVNVSSTVGSIAALVSPGTPLTQFPAFAYPASKEISTEHLSSGAVAEAGGHRRQPVHPMSHAKPLDDDHLRIGSAPVSCGMSRPASERRGAV